MYINLYHDDNIILNICNTPPPQKKSVIGFLLLLCQCSFQFESRKSRSNAVRTNTEIETLAAKNVSGYWLYV